MNSRPLEITSFNSSSTARRALGDAGIVLGDDGVELGPQPGRVDGAFRAARPLHRIDLAGSSDETRARLACGGVNLHYAP